MTVFNARLSEVTTAIVDTKKKIQELTTDLESLEKEWVDLIKNLDPNLLSLLSPPAKETPEPAPTTDKRKRRETKPGTPNDQATEYFRSEFKKKKKQDYKMLRLVGIAKDCNCSKEDVLASLQLVASKVKKAGQRGRTTEWEIR